MEDKIKNYCKYLIDEYDKIKFGNGGRVNSDLNQFYEEGQIKDLINKNDNDKTKINILEIYRDKIEFFARNNMKDINLITFKKFVF